MQVVNGREIPSVAGELNSQEPMDKLKEILTECANAFSATVDGDTLALTALSCSGIASFTGDNADGVLISGNNTDGLHISGTNTANAIHISGDQACAVLVDVDAALATGISFAVDTGITMTTGISMVCTGTGTITTAISLDYSNSATECIAITLATGKTITTGMSMSGAGTYTTGILLDATAIGTGISISGATTTAISVTGNATDAFKILTGTFTTGINLAGTLTTGITIGACTTGVSVTGATTTAISVTGNATTAISVLTGTFTTGLSIAGTTTTGISITSGSLTDGIKISGTTPVDGIEISSACSGNGINVSGACADGIEIGGACTAAALHISGDQVIAILYDVTAAATDAFKVAVPTGVALTDGIEIACTSTGTVANGINMTGTGTFTSGITLAGSAMTTGITISAGTMTDAVLISGTTPVDGVHISSACSGSAINLAGASATGITIARGHTSGAIRIGAWAAAAATGNAVVMANTMHDGVDTSQLDLVSAFGETVADLTSAYSSKIGRFRHLINVAGVVAQETYGVVGQVVIKSADLSHYHGGVMGTVEGNTSFTVSTSYGVGAVIGRVGATGVTVDSGGLLAGFLAVENTSAITANNGTIAGFATHKTAGGLIWPVGLYIQSGSATMAIDATCSAIGATGRVAKLVGACADGNLGDGYGMVECDMTITGTLAGMVAPLSSWVNMISVTTGANYVCSQSNGLYSEAGGVLTNGVFVFGMRAQCLLQTNGGAGGATFYPFSVVNNTNVTTAIFLCNDATSDLGETTISEGAATYVPLFQDNEGLRYVKTFLAS